MRQPHLEVGEIIRRYEADFLRVHGDSTSWEQKRVLRNLASCRTPALGGHVYQCDTCGQFVGTYNSCSDRHCPSCHAREAAEWTAARQAELLPVPYFHAVFTLPHELGPLALQNRQVVYGLLFRAASETLLSIAADPKHLGARIGFLSVLHTWGQTLQFHPHLHCVIPGGGLSLDGSSWVGRGERFFLPVRVLSALFRGKFLGLLRCAFDRGELAFHGALAPLALPAPFRALLDAIHAKDWGVHMKPPFGGPEQVLKYLARYTHRVAISSHRIISIDNGQVTFWWKDYAHANQQRVMTLPAVEFIRRFLLHVLPKGFVRLRYYGLLANRGRKANITRCRKLLTERLSADQVAELTPDPTPSTQTDAEATRLRQRPCPFCTGGHLTYVSELKPYESLPPPRNAAATSSAFT